MALSKDKPKYTLEMRCYRRMMKIFEDFGNKSAYESAKRKFEKAKLKSKNK